jgi:sucrose phosphorylase
MLHFTLVANDCIIGTPAGDSKHMHNQVQLITYIDRLSGGGIAELAALLQGPLGGLFGGVHLLPFFTPIDGADAGFDPIDHACVDPRLGEWRDIAMLATQQQIVADLIVNHISRSSAQFQDYLKRGTASPWAGLFLTRDRVFPAGAQPHDLQAIYRPRPGLPFSAATLSTGEAVDLWTTFTPEQIDIDVTHPLGQQYLDNILQTFASNGVKLIRLDAVGYAIKKPGTSCFMLPETFDFIAELSARVHQRGMEVLVEIHSHYRKQVEIARLVDWVYDFALPPLVLHAFAFRTAKPLQHWLQIRPHNALTVLDTHDGIGVIDIGAERDEPGLVPPAELDALVETIHRNSKGQSREATGAAASNLDLYQVNCTYYDALGRNDRKYLIARALQFFVPGIPQVYYVGLLAGENDMQLLQQSGVGRDINRHYYTRPEVEAALERPVVANLCALIRLRSNHPAFQGQFSLRAGTDTALNLRWDNVGEFAELHIDFSNDWCQLRLSQAGQCRELDIAMLRGAYE